MKLSSLLLKQQFARSVRGVLGTLMAGKSAGFLLCSSSSASFYVHCPSCLYYSFVVYDYCYLSTLQILQCQAAQKCPLISWICKSFTNNMPSHCSWDFINNWTRIVFKHFEGQTIDSWFGSPKHQWCWAFVSILWPEVENVFWTIFQRILLPAIEDLQSLGNIGKVFNRLSCNGHVLFLQYEACGFDWSWNKHRMWNSWL